MSYDYDLFVIGAGSGGVRAARLAGQAGLKVACAEESKPGGTCVVRGCVPKKFFVFASEFGRAFDDAQGYGWRFDSPPTHNWPTLRDNVQAEVARLSGIYTNILERNGVEFFPERAEFIDPHTLRLLPSGKTVSADKILIAVGGHPICDETIEGHELGIVSDDAFTLPALPRRAVVAGGGYIAIEFAYILAGLGVETTLVYRGPKILRGFDEDLRDYCEGNLAAAGIRYINNTIFERIEAAGEGRRVHLSNGDVLHTDLVFWAIGRRPSTSGLGLDHAGVEVDLQGAVVVDEDSRTNVEHIFALGDVTNRVNLTPVAIREAVAFIDTQFKNTPHRMDYAFIPKAVFSQPPLSSVGFTAEEAKAAGYEVDIYKTDFRAMRNVIANNPQRVVMKLIVCRKEGTVLGCHMAGTDTPEMLQVAAIAVKAKLTKAQFDATCALHPTVSEELVTLNEKVEG
ncbi:MAG: glutathione-disulfide reductase [Parvularcula sp.]|jgi:glutathione reductase (NADPH)|nr:glutathione-disulfide reductase [Parvularcula sp.]